MPQEFLWIFTASSLLGAYLNAKGRLLESSVIWGLSNCVWFCVDLNAGLLPQAALYAAFIATNVIGVRTAIKAAKEDTEESWDE